MKETLQVGGRLPLTYITKGKTKNDFKSNKEIIDYIENNTDYVVVKDLGNELEVVNSVKPQAAHDFIHLGESYLKDVSEIGDGVIVFMPSGFQADLKIDDDGNVIVEYGNQVDTYTKEEFDKAIKEGILLFNEPTAVIMEGYVVEGPNYKSTCYKTTEEASRNLLDYCKKHKLNPNDYKILYKNKDDDWKEIKESVFGRQQIHDINKAYHVHNSTDDAETKQNAVTLMDNAGLGVEVTDEVDKLTETVAAAPDLVMFQITKYTDGTIELQSEDAELETQLEEVDGELLERPIDVKDAAISALQNYYDKNVAISGFKYDKDTGFGTFTAAISESLESDEVSELGLYMQTDRYMYDTYIMPALKKLARNIPVNWFSIATIASAKYNKEIERHQFTQEELQDAADYIRDYYIGDIQESMNEVSDELANKVAEKRLTNFVNAPELGKDSEEEVKKLYKNIKLMDARNKRKENNMGKKITEASVAGKLAKMLKEEFDEDVFNKDNMLTPVENVDLPDALADTIVVDDNGKPVTIESVYEELKSMRKETIDLINSIKDTIIAEIKAVKDEMAATQAEELNDVADQLDDIEDGLEDKADALNPKAAEEVENAEEAPAEENAEETEVVEESYKKFITKGKIEEDLTQGKQEVDKLAQKGATGEEIKKAIEIKADSDDEKKELEDYAVSKLTESLLNTSKTSVLSQIKH